MKLKTCRSVLSLTLGASAVLSAAGNAFANTGVSNFGSLLAGNDFGGSGIVSNQVAFSTTTVGNDVITLGLSATSSGIGAPPVGSDGMDTFYVVHGSGDGGFTPWWNFDFYINNTGGIPGDYTYNLLFGTSTGSEFIDPTESWLGDTVTASTVQNSLNLGEDGFGSEALDPLGYGIFDFTLQVLNANGAVVASDSMQVDVGAVPDTFSTLTLLGATVGGLFIAGRKPGFVPTA